MPDAAFAPPPRHRIATTHSPSPRQKAPAYRGQQQRGTGHTGTLRQEGNANSYGLFQFGRNTTADVTQASGETGAAVVFGW